MIELNCRKELTWEVLTVTRIPLLMILSFVVFGLVIGAGARNAVQAETLADGVVASADDSTASENADSIATTPELIAYYFHTTARCVSCKKIEAYATEAIETGFAEAIKAGTLKFESVNIDEDENKHFIKDFQLYTKSVVVCDMDNGELKEWKNLTKVWQLLGDKDEFVRYVQDEINAYLKEN